MRDQIIKSLHELDELEARRELLPTDMIDQICELFAPDDRYTRNKVMRIFRANTQERREVSEQVKVTRSNIQAMVKSYGATVKAAGFSASFSAGGLYADSKRLKLDAEGDPLLARYLKRKADSCRITRSKS